MTWIALLGVVCLFVSLSEFLGVLRRQGVFTKIQSLVAGTAFLVVAGLSLGLVGALRSFEAFADSRPVARVHCRWLREKTFEVEFTPLLDGSPQPAQTFELRGDQWSIGGGVVRWHPWLAVAGLSNYHKLTRLSGRYALVEDEVSNAPTAVDLNGGFDALWEWIVRFDPFLPFIEAAYGSTAYAYVNPALDYEVDVTPAGYLIRSVRKPPGLRSPNP